NIRILLTTKHLTTRGPRKRKEHYNLWAHQHQWFCNGNNSSDNDHFNTTSPSPARLVGTGDQHGHTLVLECPSTVTTLHSLVANGPGGINVTYGNNNLTDFYRCQTQDHPLNTLPSNLSFVAQTTLAFAPARRMLPSWIEYHRAITGIQHFIIYVNEPWETFSRNKDYFYHPPYVTYVPFRESFGKVEYMFQQAAQIDALHRLKSYSSVEWVAMMDVDEYFQVQISPNNATEAWTTTASAHNATQGGALLQVLRQQLEISGDEELASFVVTAHLFGYHPHYNSSLFRDLPICAQLGRRPTMGGMKPIVRPKQTNYVSVHVVSGGEKQIVLDPISTGVRYGHFHAERAKFDEEDVVLDESFRHQACDVVRHELQAYFPRYKDDNMTAPPGLYAYDTEQHAGSRVILPSK
ncbi:MAG: hypothetical protein SGILL_009486, partial [Bacillariaceae sp.]